MGCSLPPLQKQDVSPAWVYARSVQRRVLRKFMQNTKTDNRNAEASTGQIMLHLTTGLTVYILFITALSGLAMGSFLNCWAYRLTTGESILKGRSHCPACGHTLGALDLIPVASYVFLGGKCRYCKEKLSIRYLVAELVCAAYFVSVVWHFDVTPEALKFLIMGSLLFCAGLVDLETQIIPDRLIIGVIANFLLFTLLSKQPVLPALWQGVVGGLSISLPLLIVVLLMDRILKRESMGGGDIKLLFAIGMYFTWQKNLFLLIVACVAGIILGLSKKGFRDDKENPGAFPFGPAIIFAYWIALLFGEPVLVWYQSLFHFL